jgi:hypothetical protein
VRREGRAAAHHHVAVPLAAVEPDLALMLVADHVAALRGGLRTCGVQTVATSGRECGTLGELVYY